MLIYKRKLCCVLKSNYYHDIHTISDIFKNRIAGIQDTPGAHSPFPFPPSPQEKLVCYVNIASAPTKYCPKMPPPNDMPPPSPSFVGVF
jgi:hypothetical protein